LIVTWRGQPGVADEPQHALMGPITPQLLELMQIPWELFPARREEIAPALERATRHMDSSGQPYALLMQKGTVAACELKADPLTAARPPGHAPLVDAAGAPPSLVSRAQALTQVLACTADAATVVLASTGFCGRELFALEDRPGHFYMVGSMGCVSAIALGLALSRPDLRVVALDGDGAALMRMGTFATIGAYAPPNLWHLLLDNAAHDSTGGQADGVTPHLICRDCGGVRLCFLAADLRAWKDRGLARCSAAGRPPLRLSADTPGLACRPAAPLARAGRGQGTTQAAHWLTVRPLRLRHAAPTLSARTRSSPQQVLPRGNGVRNREGATA
jgi:hypothetical protein